VVEVDEAYWGGEEEGVIGRKTEAKALIAVAAEERGRGLGRVRLRRIAAADRRTLHAFIADAVEPGSTVRTDGLNAYLELSGYTHDRHIQRRQPPGVHLLPRVHRVISLLKRWLLGTHQGAISHAYLEDYLNEFTFRLNRRTSKSRGKLFYRLAQQAVAIDPAPLKLLGQPQYVDAG
jgi:transposase-like protein